MKIYEFNMKLWLLCLVICILPACSVDESCYFKNERDYVFLDTPQVRYSGGHKEIVIPIVREYKEKIGELILGKSTLTEVSNLITPCFYKYIATFSPEFSSWLSEEMVKTLKNTKVVFYEKNYRLGVGFDRNDRVTFIHYIVDSTQRKNFFENNKYVSDYRSVHYGSFLVKIGVISPCVTLETKLRPSKIKIEKNELVQVTYFYICDTDSN